jgi:hypothetical protein
MTTASPAACQRVNPRRQPETLPASYTTAGDTTYVILSIGRAFTEDASNNGAGDVVSGVDWVDR